MTVIARLGEGGHNLGGRNDCNSEAGKGWTQPSGEGMTVIARLGEGGTEPSGEGMTVIPRLGERGHNPAKK
jgi:hypothetical protein